MADTAVTLKVAKKTKLEREFDAAERRREAATVRNKKAEAKRTQANESKAAGDFREEATELLSVFRKKTPVTFHKGFVEFSFRGTSFTIYKTEWTMGGESADPDDYKTNHEGWKIYGAGGRRWDNYGCVLFEIERYSTPPRLKPSPQAFCDAITNHLREVEDERRRDSERRMWNYFR